MYTLELQSSLLHDRNSKPQQEHHLGTVSKSFTWGLKSSLHGHNPRLSSAVVYTRHLFSPREAFLTR